jgi:GNAT superfamily N-acetyltransferase
MPVSHHFRVERFVAAAASDEELRKRFELEDALLREYDPDAATVPHDRRLMLIRDAKPPYYSAERVWVARGADGRFIGIGWLGEGSEAPDAHGGRACFVLVGVLQSYRRRGVASALLRELALYAEAHGYAFIESVWRSDMQHRFTDHLRGPSSRPQDGHRVDLAGVDWNLLQRWINDGRTNSPGARIETYIDDLPLEAADDVLRSWTLLHDGTPCDEINRQLPQLRAQWQAQTQSRKAVGERWLAIVVRDGDGHIAALTEAIFNPRTPKVLLVRLAGVHRGSWGRGLRKWMQAELFLRVRTMLPNVEHVAYRHEEHGPLQRAMTANGLEIGRFRATELLRRLT